MSKLNKKLKRLFIRKERGQVLVVVAISIIAIVAIVGLSLDVGIMFIDNARLRRAVDSAALAAALQFREGYQMSELDSSAVQFLRLNGIEDPNALVQVCDGPDYSHTIPPELCPENPRKFVRVVATGVAQLAFLPVIGINEAPIAAEATSETASVAVVLVIDRSDSMTWTADPATPMRDPSVCNNPDDPAFVDPGSPTYDSSYTGYCRPFYDVKKAAVDFVDQLYFPYDSVALVTFDKEAQAIEINGYPGFSNDQGDIVTAIKELTVFQGDETAIDPVSGATGSIYAIYPNGNPSRWYDINDVYYGLSCPQAVQNSYPNNSPAPCTTTNIGAGLYNAGVQFTSDMQTSLWVVILLTDGVANAGFDEAHTYYCPEDTWDYTNVPPKCNDGRSATHHVEGSAAYDAEDYAYDAANFVGLPFPAGQNALIFTIGLGSAVRTASTVDGTYLGDLFLQYAANQGNGLYAYSPDAAGLREIFRKIAQNIATRLAH